VQTSIRGWRLAPSEHIREARKFAHMEHAARVAAQGFDHGAAAAPAQESKQGLSSA